MLVFEVEVEFPSTRGLDRTARRAIGRAKSRTRREMRFLLNDMRRNLRVSGPRATGRMLRSVRVKPASHPRARTQRYKLTVGTVAAAPTNAVPPHRGWFADADRDYNVFAHGLTTRAVADADRIIAESAARAAKKRARKLSRGLRVLGLTLSIVRGKRRGPRIRGFTVLSIVISLILPP